MSRWIVAGAVLAGFASAGQASAAVTTRNSCQYSYDTYWRDIEFTMAGTTTPAAAAPGASVSLHDLQISAALPGWLAEYGHRFGLLHEGYNEIPATVWVAVRGTNTAQGVQVLRLEATAQTTIVVDSAGQPQPAPIVYSLADVPDITWTSRMGTIEFAQAPAGSLPAIPAGPGGAPITPKGSVYIQARLGPATLGLDCLPGTYTADGASHSNAVALPFAQTDVPSFVCIAPVPAATSVAPVDMRVLLNTPVPEGIPGAPRAVSPLLRYRIPNAYLAALRDAGRLQTGDNTVRFDAQVALDGANTVEARRVSSAAAVEVVVRVAGDGTITVRPGPDATPDLAGETPFTPATWTPAVPAALHVSVAPPASMGSLAPPGSPTSVTPYGSLLAGLTVTPPGGAPSRVGLDCVTGSVAVANGGIPYAPGGNRAAPDGDAGRYAITAVPLDPFASALVEDVGVAPRAVPAPAPAAAPAPVVAPIPTAPARPRATAAPPRPVLRIVRTRTGARLEVRAARTPRLAGRRVQVQRRVGRRVYALATFTVPRTGRIVRTTPLNPKAKTGPRGIRAASAVSIRFRVLGSTGWTAVNGKYRTVRIPAAVRRVK